MHSIYLENTALVSVKFRRTISDRSYNSAAALF